jgi:hypothetical protein
MSDFNRNDPLNRPVEPRIDEPLSTRPVIVESEGGSGFGVLAGIAVAALVAIGGYYFYSHSDSVKTAANDTVTTSSTASAIKPSTGAPATTTPQLNPVKPAPTPPASTPAQ